MSSQMDVGMDHGWGEVWSTFTVLIRKGPLQMQGGHCKAEGDMLSHFKPSFPSVLMPPAAASSGHQWREQWKVGPSDVLDGQLCPFYSPHPPFYRVHCSCKYVHEQIFALVNSSG